MKKDLSLAKYFNQYKSDPKINQKITICTNRYKIVKHEFLEI